MTVLSLWLPILVSALAVFAMSAVVHMVFGYHARDFTRMPGEEAVGAAMRDAGVPPGQYTMPHAESMAAMATDEHRARLDQGPVALVVVRANGQVDMGRQFGLWFALNLLVSVFAAYLASRALTPAAGFGDIFRYTATVPALVYVLGGWSESIWYARSWSMTFRNTIDGVIYMVVTGLTFGLLWPG